MKLVCVMVTVLLLFGCGLFNDPVPPVLSEWQATSSLTIPRSSHAAVATSGHVYVLGGSDGAELWTDSVEFAPIQSDGSLGPWTETTPMPQPSRHHEAFVYGDHVFVVGGNFSIILDDVISAPINADGTLGAWSSTTALPSSLYEFALVVHDNTVVALGGGFSQTQSVVYATINSDGTVGAWQTGPDLLQPRTRHAAAIHGGTIYLIGGDDGSGNAVLEVEQSTLGVGGEPGVWSIAAELPSSRSRGNAASIGNYLFAIGGSSPSGANLFAEIGTDGSVGVWEEGPTSSAESSHAAAVSGSFIYVTGGYSGTHVGSVEFSAMQR